MNCDECGEKTQTVRASKRHYRSGIIWIIEDVEIEECPSCGERYCWASVIHDLDREIDKKVTR
jgi:ArsR family metal-binding transcriptional regulator